MLVAVGYSIKQKWKALDKSDASGTDENGTKRLFKWSLKWRQFLNVTSAHTEFTRNFTVLKKIWTNDGYSHKKVFKHNYNILDWKKIAQNYSLLFQKIKIVNNFAAKPHGINEYGSNICIVLVPPNCHNNTYIDKM